MVKRSIIRAPKKITKAILPKNPPRKDQLRPQRSKEDKEFVILNQIYPHFTVKLCRAIVKRRPYPQTDEFERLFDNILLLLCNEFAGEFMSILTGEFEFEESEIADKQFSEKETAEIRAYIISAYKSLLEIKDLAPTSLQEKYNAIDLIYIDKQKESYNKIASNNDALSFLEAPDASIKDVDSWLKQSVWTMEEAISLLLDKDPSSVNFKTLQGLVTPSHFLENYRKRFDFLSRSRNSDLSGPLTPDKFISWCHKKGFTLPETLVVAAPSVSSEEIDRLQRENAELRQLVEAYSAEFGEGKTALKIARWSLYLILRVLAERHFKHTPDAKTTKATTLIHKEIVKSEFYLSKDTIHDWLKTFDDDPAVKEELKKWDEKYK